MSLWTFFQSEIIVCSPHKRTRKIPNKNQRASFCTCHKCSYTLEAAIVIPLLAGYLVTILFFFSILEIQCIVDEALLYAGRKTAVESSVVDSEELLLLSAEGYMLSVLHENQLLERYVKHGVWGISLWESEFEGEYIRLKAEYVVELPIRFGKLGQIRLSSQNCFRKWLGDETVVSDENVVYVTPNGEVYHSSLTCRSINLKVRTATIKEIPNLRGADGQKYYECTRCIWDDENKERIYYTDYGVRYHKSISCSALKRNVEKIDLKDVGDRRPCSFCYGL